MAASGVGPQNPVATNEPQPLNRRRALWVLGALAAAGGAALTALRPDEARANTGSFTDTVAFPGAVVSSTNNGSGAAVYGTGGSGFGLWGASSTNAGVFGFSTSYVGYSAAATATLASGVRPTTATPTAFAGSMAAAACGVQGITASAPNGHPAVLGQNGGAGPGVQGFSSGSGSIGASGGSDVGVGFWGTANGGGTGVLGS
jgi:hypothetical protein